MLRTKCIATVVLTALVGAVDAQASDVLRDRPLTPAEERSIKPGDIFRECSLCPEMVVIPAGRFTMGSLDSEARRDNDEGPEQEVTIAAPFAAGRFEITFAEWDACLDDGGCGGFRPPDAGWGRGRQPVIIVSWDDAKAYVSWLSAKTGRSYRLLSEAEWEYVARAGTRSPFWWGDTITARQANYDGRLPYIGGEPGDFRHRTLPVDSFRANPFGLYNVHGNVWEWVEDCWHRRYSEMPEATRTAGAPWTSPDCEFRVFRGGSWSDGAHVLRSANRGRYEPYIRNTNGGFRVARTLAR